jgi:hypothetical protein
MRKFLFFAAFALLLFNALHGFSVETAPPVTLSFRPGTGAGEGQGIAVGNNGTIYSTGHYSGTGSFGSTTLTNGGAQDYYLSAHSPSGTVLWAVRAGSTLSDFGSDVAIDGNGNILVAGVAGRSVAGNTVDFNNVTNVASFGGQDIFLAKYTSSGNLLWVRFAGSTGNDQAFDVAVDGSGNYLISGRITGVANFSGTNIGSNGQTRSFLAKYDSDGQLLWVRDVGSTDSSATTGIAADASGNSYICGLSVSPDGPFVAKYNSSGTQVWKQTATGGASFFNENSSVAVDTNGNVYVAGRFGNGTTPLVYGSVSIANPNGVIQGYIVQFNSSGTAQWASVTGARAFDIMTSSDGSVYTTGFFSSTANSVGGQTLVNSGSQDAFIAKFTNAGALAWVLPAGTSGNDLGRAITLSSSGSIFATGEGSSGLFTDFPGGVFVVQLTPPPIQPTLTINLSGSNLIISWEPIFTGFAIETTTDLGVSFAPTALSFTEVIGQANTYSLANPPDNLFIRLKKTID